MLDPRTLPPAMGYAYVLPGGWLELDLDRSGLESSVRRAVAARVRREPALAPHLVQLDRWLLAECLAAAAAGARRVGLFAERVEGRVLTAAVTMALEPVPAPVEPLDATGILDRLGDAGGVRELVELAQLTAVRRTWDDVDTLAPGPGPPTLPAPHPAPTTPSPGLPVRHWQLLVPSPGRPQIGLLTMSSPSPPLWPLLEATFEACAATYHWTWAPTARQPARPPDHQPAQRSPPD